MARQEIATCDECDSPLEFEEGGQPTTIGVQPKRPRSIGAARDEHELCDQCTATLYAAFPRFARALRLVTPTPTPTAIDNATAVAALDTVTPETLIVMLAERLGVKIKQTPDS